MKNKEQKHRCSKIHQVFIGRFKLSVKIVYKTIMDIKNACDYYAPSKKGCSICVLQE